MSRNSTGINPHGCFELEYSLLADASRFFFFTGDDLCI